MALLLFFFLLVFPAEASDEEMVLFREDFADFGGWEEVNFSRSPDTKYRAVIVNGVTAVRAESDRSASAIIHKEVFNVFEYPNLRWRWRAENIYEKGGLERKDTEDFPVRVCVMFKYDPGDASFFTRIKYGYLKERFGRYPPQKNLCYIWANKEHDESVHKSPFDPDRQRFIVKEAGSEHLGRWREEEGNIVEDYREAFGEDPPEEASIGVMNDSDNTKESSVSYVDFIEVFR